MGEVVKVSLLTPEEISTFWSKIADAMLRLEHLWCDKWTMDYFFQAAMSQHIQLWGIGEDNIEYLIVTEVRNYPASRFLEVLFIFGDGNVRECVKAFNPCIHAYAQMQNCSCIEIPDAREGWERELKGIAVKTGVVLLSRVSPTTVN